MADVEEPQFSTLAERIAALNKQKNFSSSAPAPAPTPRPLVRSATTTSVASAVSAASAGSTAPAAAPGVRRPPPPPPTKPAALNSPTNPSPAPSPTTAVAANKPRPTPPLVPIRSATVRTTGSGNGTSGNTIGGSPLAKPPPPKLPPRQPSTLQKPQLPVARQPSADSVVSQHSIASAVSRVSTATSQSHGSASKSVVAGGDTATLRKLPPAFGATALPALPPSRREREAREREAREAAEEEAAAREAAEREADEQNGSRWDDRPPELPNRPGSLSRRESHASQRSDWGPSHGDDGGRPSLPPRLPSRPSARPSYQGNNDSNYGNHDDYEERTSTSSRLSSAKSALGSGFSWGKAQIKKRTGGGGGGDGEQAPNPPRRPTISENRDDYGRDGYGRGNNGDYGRGGHGDGNRNSGRDDRYGDDNRNDHYGDGPRNRSRNDSYGEGSGNRNGGRNDRYGDGNRNDRRNDDRRDRYDNDDDDDERPPPLPMASRPSRAQVDAVVHGNDRPPPQPPRPGARGGANAAGSRRDGGNDSRDDRAQCLKCRDFSAPDAVAAEFPLSRLPHDGTVVYLAHNLCGGFESETDKARAIFTWCHHNIAYDVDGFFSGRMPQGQTMEERIFSGKAVCEGYARVYEAIAEAAGLECVVVSGHGKGFGFRAVRPGEPVPRPDPTGHAWNAVRIDGGMWKLVDPCWGAGNVTDQRRYEKRFSPAMFTMDNETFGERHFPADPQYFFRADGRALSWREYIVEKETAAPIILFSNMPEQFLAAEAVEPRAGVLAAAGPGARPDDMVTFRFGRACRHWTEERDGRNLAPYPMMLQVLAADGSRDGPMFDVHYDRPLLFWAEVPRRSLGRPGDQLFCYAVTKMDGRDMRGTTMADFRARLGRCSYAIEGVCAWKIV